MRIRVTVIEGDQDGRQNATVKGPDGNTGTAFVQQGTDYMLKDGESITISNSDEQGSATQNGSAARGNGQTNTSANATGTAAGAGMNNAKTNS